MEQISIIQVLKRFAGSQPLNEPSQISARWTDCIGQGAEQKNLHLSTAPTTSGVRESKCSHTSCDSIISLCHQHGHYRHHLTTRQGGCWDKATAEISREQACRAHSTRCLATSPAQGQPPWQALSAGNLLMPNQAPGQTRLVTFDIFAISGLSQYEQMKGESITIIGNTFFSNLFE